MRKLSCGRWSGVVGGGSGVYNEGYMAAVDTNQQAHRTATTGKTTVTTIPPPLDPTPLPPFTPSSLEEGGMPDFNKSALLPKTVMDIATRTVTLSSGQMITVIDSWVAAVDGRGWQPAS